MIENYPNSLPINYFTTSPFLSIKIYSTKVYIFKPPELIIELNNTTHSPEFFNLSNISGAPNLAKSPGKAYYQLSAL